MNERERKRRVSNESEATRLAEEHHKYVHTIVNSLVRLLQLPPHLEDELVSAGYLALVSAASRFDSSRGVCFKAYSIRRVRGSLIDYLRAESVLSARARYVARVIEGIDSARVNVVTGPVHASKARRTNRDGKSERVARILDHAARGLIAVSMGDGAEVERQPDSRAIAADRALIYREAQFRIRDLVWELPKREREILLGFYYRDESLTSIAERLGVTTSWVSRLHGSAIETLRTRLLELTAEAREACRGIFEVNDVTIQSGVTHS